MLEHHDPNPYPHHTARAGGACGLDLRLVRCGHSHFRSTLSFAGSCQPSACSCTDRLSVALATALCGCGRPGSTPPTDRRADTCTHLT
eukprot:2681869-Prymnesium_polylepis.1